MLNPQRRALMSYRLHSAAEKLQSAKLLLDNGQYKDSIGRSYYAMFSAIRALLAVDGVDFKKHSGVISYFQREYIKSKTFDVKYSKYITSAFQIRNNADYADFFLVSVHDAKQQYSHAKELYDIIQNYLQQLK